MARDERVVYSCDVCGKQERARQIKPDRGQPYYMRPKGWGALSGIIEPLNGDHRVKAKWDFCSEPCARERLEEVLADAYSPGD